MSQSELFKKYYYSDSNIYSNNELWKQIQKDDKFDSSIKRKDYDNWLAKQEDEQVQKVIYKPNKSLMHPIIAPPQSYQSDLMFLKDLHTLNDGYDAIINFIEMTTKKVYSYPLKSKSANAIMDVFKIFYGSIDGKLEVLEIDKGTEYNQVKKFCDDNEIRCIVYNNDKNSMSIAERFNRTLRNYIKKVCKNGKWKDKLNTIIIAYNSKIHSSSGFSPDYLTDHPKQQNIIRERLIGLAIDAKLELKKIKIGDKVRVYHKRSLFGKGNGQYSNTVHTITDIINNSLFLDNNDTKKYRYYNVIKVGDVEISPSKEVDEAVKIAKSNYKVAHKLAKELKERVPVKEADKILQEIVSKPKEKRNVKKHDYAKLSKGK